MPYRAMPYHPGIRGSSTARQKRLHVFVNIESFTPMILSFLRIYISYAKAARHAREYWMKQFESSPMLACQQSHIFQLISRFAVYTFICLWSCYCDKIVHIFSWILNLLSFTSTIPYFLRKAIYRENIKSPAFLHIHRCRAKMNPAKMMMIMMMVMIMIMMMMIVE